MLRDLYFASLLPMVCFLWRKSNSPDCPINHLQTDSDVVVFRIEYSFPVNIKNFIILVFCYYALKLF